MRTGLAEALKLLDELAVHDVGFDIVVLGVPREVYDGLAGEHEALVVRDGELVWEKDRHFAGGTVTVESPYRDRGRS